MNELTIKIARKAMKDVKRGVADEPARALMRELDETAFVLYEYYVRKSYLENYDFPDEDAAKELGWKLSKVARTRRKLTKAHWIYRESGIYSSGRKLLTIYLGKDTVLAALGIRELAPWEELAISKRVAAELDLSDDDSWKDNKLLARKAKKLFKQYHAEAEKTLEPVNKQKAIADELEELNQSVD